MEIINDKTRLESILNEKGIRKCFGLSEPRFQLMHFSPGELLTTAFSRTEYLLFVVEGSLILYDMPDEESVVHIETAFNDVNILGEIEVFDEDYESFFVEATSDVYAIGLRLESEREELLKDPVFLLNVCRSLEAKLNGAVLSAYGGNLKGKIKKRIARLGKGGHIRDISHLASVYGASPRQLMRVLKSFCDEGVLEHTGKGDYLIK